MAAKIYSGIKNISVPKLSFIDIPKYEKEVEQYIERLRTISKAQSKDDCVGEIIRFPVADGHAEYMVFSMKPLQLIHIATWDKWQSESAELLTVKRVKEMVQLNKKLEKIFS